MPARRFEEGTIGEFQQESGGSLTNQTDVTNGRYKLRAGFNTSPWRWVSWEAEYKRQYSESDYNHMMDVFYDPFYGDPLYVAPVSMVIRRSSSTGKSKVMELTPG